MVNTRGRAGYTLIEMLIAVAILGIIAGTGGKMMEQTNRYFITTNSRTDLQREARAAMYIINRSVRQGSVGSVLIDQAASQPYYSRLSFNKIQGSRMVFAQSGKSLIQTVGTKTRTLTNNLKYISFTFPRSDDLSVISVSITLEKTIYQGRVKTLHMTSEKVRIMNN